MLVGLLPYRTRSRGRFLAAVAVGTVIMGCANSPPPPQETDPMEIEYADSLDIDRDRLEEGPSGLLYIDRAQGGGAEATSGRTIVAHYTGYLPDGTVFDSSRDRGEPFSFLLGAGQVIRGWDLGFEGMKIGSRRTLVIPPEIGYGAQGAGGVIPPNAVLVFDVELIAVR